MRKIFFLFLIIILPTFVLAGCNKKTDQKSDDKLNVVVSVLPQVDFVERIGGDKVSVGAMIPPGFSPATYEPSPEQIKKLSEADLYVRIGKIGFEQAQMDKLIDINKDMLVVDSSQGVNFRQIEEHSHEHEEEHGDEHEYEEGDDPHIWLSPELVEIQAENIYEVLVELKPEHKDYFLANKNDFLTELTDLDKKLSETFLPVKGKTILVFHPAFGYLADAYDFHQEAIEVEGKDPTIENLQEIIDETKADGVKVVFVQKQFSTKSTQVVADAIGGAVVQIDPLDPDYFANLENMAYTISERLK